MHARRKPKWIGVQHGIKRVDSMHRKASATYLTTIRSRWMRNGRISSHANRGTRFGQAEIRNEGIGFCVVGFHVIEHVCWCVVLLGCTHEISLGRTKLHMQKGKRKTGQLAELVIVLLK